MIIWTTNRPNFKSIWATKKNPVNWNPKKRQAKLKTITSLPKFQFLKKVSHYLLLFFSYFKENKDEEQIEDSMIEVFGFSFTVTSF